MNQISHNAPACILSLSHHTAKNKNKLSRRTWDETRRDIISCNNSRLTRQPNPHLYNNDSFPFFVYMRRYVVLPTHMEAEFPSAHQDRKPHDVYVLIPLFLFPPPLPPGFMISYTNSNIHVGLLSSTSCPCCAVDWSLFVRGRLMPSSRRSLRIARVPP